ncbi:MAG TPA: SRPBCC family protein [Chitinophagaceae bacterium]|nr:SRPBCC family protein [Chitinophagaceae bacterium]
MDKILEIKKSLIIHAKAAVIFKVLADVENWNKWTGSVQKSRLIKGDTFAVGSKIKIIQPKLRPVIWEITEVQSDKSFTWVSNSIGLNVTAKHIIENCGDSSKVLLITTYKGFLSKIVYPLISDIANKYMTMEIDGLKQASEKFSIY